MPTVRSGGALVRVGAAGRVLPGAPWLAHKASHEGIKTVEKFVKEYQVDCDWNPCGKYFASSQISDEKIATNFSNLLSSLNFG